MMKNTTKGVVFINKKTTVI